VFNGLSYYDSGLAPQSSYRYTVTTIDTAGVRSDPAEVTVSTSTNDIGSTVNGSSGTPGSNCKPSAPQGASIMFHSSTAASLFWTRPPASERVVATEVVRNNTVLALAPGPSFYDATRQPNTVYTYELTAISDTGIRSATTVLPGNSVLPASAKLVSDWLSGISDVTNQHAHARWFQMLQDPIVPSAGITLISRQNVPVGQAGTAIRTEYSCDAGGNMVHDQFLSRFGRDEVRYDECQLPGHWIDGALNVAGADVGGYTVSYQSLTLHIGNDEFWMDGTAKREVTRSFNFVRDTIGPLDYTYRENGHDTTVTGLHQIVTDELMSSPRTGFRTSFEVSAPWTAGQPLSVSTSTTFKDADAGDGVFAIGELTIYGIEGIRLRLNANTGDRMTFQQSLHRNGFENSTIEPWSASYTLPCLSVTSGQQAIAQCEQLP
jgi:chitodextrinase